jgi:hypothetical protein
MDRLPRLPIAAVTVACLTVALPITARDARAQDADPLPAKRDTTLRVPNTEAGEFTPGAGFNIITTKRGSLNVSFYGLFRYINQMPSGQFFVDHLGQVRPVNPRNDVNWHRTMIWLTGWFHDPRFRYNITGWSLPTTQQTLIFGNLQYLASNTFNFGVGIAPSLTARSLQGSWPYWAASDRQMATEFFRGGFSSGIWMTGLLANRLTYNVSITNNISELGVTQANDTRDLFYSGSLRWQPTTGEFGARNGFGDFEYHRKAATQFGVSMGQGRVNRAAPLDQAPNATQIKLSDSVNPFELGALAPGATVIDLKYQELAADAGVKYRGFAFEGEYYFRTLMHFEADGPVPPNAIYDNGFMAEASYMVLRRKLMVYTVGGYVFDDFRRFPWEAGGGMNYYPSDTRSWRLNLHLLHVNKSPVQSFFSYYNGGQTGTIFSLGIDILL